MKYITARAAEAKMAILGEKKEEIKDEDEARREEQEEEERLIKTCCNGHVWDLKREQILSLEHICTTVCSTAVHVRTYQQHLARLPLFPRGLRGGGLRPRGFM